MLSLEKDFSIFLKRAGIELMGACQREEEEVLSNNYSLELKWLVLLGDKFHPIKVFRDNQGIYLRYFPLGRELDEVDCYTDTLL